MNSKSIIRTMGLLALLAAMLLILPSCSKTADGTLTKEQLDAQDKDMQATSIDDKDLNETDEDLATVDYKEFYDQLAPHGEWVQVKPEEIGMKPVTSENNAAGNSGFSLSNLLGVKDAYALTDANVALVYVWKPSLDLALTTTTVSDVPPVYVPYTNGQWVNTDAGWYFKAPTPVEETTSHYGRWVNSPTAGWLWVPGRVWAPAWVDWKQNDNYVSWAPLPPSTYLVNGTMMSPVIQDDNYTIVEKRFFLEPDLYRYNNVYYDNGSRILLTDFTRTDGIVLVNNTIINRGPEVLQFAHLYGRPVELVTVSHVRNFSEVLYTTSGYSVYTPGFKRFKHKGNDGIVMTGPKSFRKYDEWKDVKSMDKQFKKNEKEYQKDVKQNQKKYPGNDGDMYNGNKNNGKKYKGNDNGGKIKGNDNGKKYNGNDNGGKIKGNDNGKKNKGNDNGGKIKGNDNGKKNNGNDNGHKQGGKDKGKGNK